MNLITKPTKQKKDPVKNGVVDPDKWAKDLLVWERLHSELLTTKDSQRYKQIERRLYAIIDADGDHD